MEKLITEIQDHFGLSKSPHFPPYEKEWENSETILETKYFEGKTWTELSVSDFETYTCCHSFFPDNCAIYYLGANMFVECVEGKFNSSAMDRLFMDLQLNVLPKNNRRRRMFRPKIEALWTRMDEGQRFTVLAYLDCISDNAVLHVEVTEEFVQTAKRALRNL